MKKGKIKFSSLYSEQAEIFFNLYDYPIFIVCPDEKIKYLKPETERVCIYCKQQYPKVTFTNDAHIIPHLLGNDFLISDFECDRCNKFFSKYENDLANYIGISRTLSGKKGKKKIPQFKSPDNKIFAKKESFFDAKKAIKFGAVDNKINVFKGSIENEIISTSFTKVPYIPINIFKTFLKVALALVPDDELINYETAFNFLMETKSKIPFKKMSFPLIKYVLPRHYESPIAILLKKKKSDDFLPTHTLILHYENYQFQIYLPFNSEDYKLFEIGQIYIPIAPPFFDGSGNIDIVHRDLIIDDLSSLEIRKEEENICLKIESSSLQNTTAINPITRKIVDKKIKISEITGFYLVEKGLIINISD